MTGSGRARWIGSGWSRWYEALLALAYPPICQLCQMERASARNGFVGARCLSRLQPPRCERCGLPFAGAITETFECANCRELTLEFEWARAAVVANDVVLDLIHRYKYHRALCFEPLLARLLVRAARHEVRPGHWDMIVPVPLHPLKKREREFNQAERLARRLGGALRIPVCSNVVHRIAITRSQTKLSRRERAENMRRAFLVTAEEGLAGTRILLVDDVLTTGATTSACAAPLKAAGVAEIGVWTVARGT